MNKHDEYCVNIVKDLEAIANGELICIDGELMPIEMDDNNILYVVTEDLNTKETKYYTETGDTIIIDGKKHISEIYGDFWPATMYEYFDEYFNIDYIVDGSKEFTACRIMIACGGPNVYINTWEKCVELYWWSEMGKAYLPGYVCDAINEYFEELYYC